MGGPLAALAISAVGTPAVLHLTENLLGAAGGDLLNHLPEGSKLFIEHVTAHLFGGQLHGLAGSGPRRGYNHDLRRGMVLSIHNVLAAQIADLNALSPRHADAWSSAFTRQFRTSISHGHARIERNLRELFKLWLNRLACAVHDDTGRRLDELFPRQVDALLPADSSQFDQALAEAAAYAAAREGCVADIWHDLFDHVLAPAAAVAPAEQTLRPPEPAPRRWFGFGPRRAEPPYDEQVRALLNLVGQDGIGLDLLRNEVSRFLQHHFPAEFAEVVKSDEQPEFRKAWIAYHKLLLETTSAAVTGLCGQVESLRDEQRNGFTELAARIQILAQEPSFLGQFADSSASIIAVLTQSERRISETVRAESTKLGKTLDLVLEKLDRLPGAVVDEFVRRELVPVKRKASVAGIIIAAALAVVVLIMIMAVQKRQSAATPPAARAILAQLAGLPAEKILSVVFVEGSPPLKTRFISPQLRLVLVARRQEETALAVLRDGETLRSRVDHYRVGALPETDGYLYLFQVDSNGRVDWIFPKQSDSPHSSGSNPVRADQKIVLPVASEFYLDATPGVEHLYAVFSSEPLPNLERAVAIACRDSAKSITLSANVQPTAGKIQEPNRFGLRGVGGSDPSPAGAELLERLFGGANVEASSWKSDEDGRLFAATNSILVVERWFYHH